MDFHSLLAKMQKLDQPTTENISVTDEGDCGMNPMSAPEMPGKPDTPPPSMSVNLNAQGMDNIEQMMKLFQKVNPDMMPKDPAPMSSLSPEPSIMSIKPSMPPLKMLPDLNDKPETHSEPDGDEGPIIKIMGKDDSKEKSEKEEYANEPDPVIKGLDVIIPDGNDLNKPKKTYPKVAGGDNPMQKIEDSDLRAQVRAELLQRLAEAKNSYSAKAARAGKDIGKPGKQFAKIAKSAGEKYGRKERGEKVAGAVLAKLRKG